MVEAISAAVIGAGISSLSTIQSNFDNVNRNCKVNFYNETDDPFDIVDAHKWYGWVNESEGNQATGRVEKKQCGMIYMRKRGDNATGCTYTFVIEFKSGKRVSIYVSVGYSCSNQLGCDEGNVIPQDIKDWDHAPKDKVYEKGGKRIRIEMNNKSCATCNIWIS